MVKKTKNFQGKGCHVSHAKNKDRLCTESISKRIEGFTEDYLED